MKNHKITNTDTYESIKLEIDAQALCQRLDRYVRGNRKAFSVVRVPTAEVAIARQLAVDLWRVFTGQTTAENLGLVYQPDAA